MLKLAVFQAIDGTYVSAGPWHDGSAYITIKTLKYFNNLSQDPRGLYKILASASDLSDSRIPAALSSMRL